MLGLEQQQQPAEVILMINPQPSSSSADAGMPPASQLEVLGPPAPRDQVYMEVLLQNERMDLNVQRAQMEADLQELRTEWQAQVATNIWMARTEADISESEARFAEMRTQQTNEIGEAWSRLNSEHRHLLHEGESHEAVGEHIRQQAAAWDQEAR